MAGGGLCIQGIVCGRGGGGVSCFFGASGDGRGVFAHFMLVFVWFWGGGVILEVGG